jgi:hypothetical protein
MNFRANIKNLAPALFAILTLVGTRVVLHSQAAKSKQPNIVVIMADDVGIWNISAYHRGMMGGRTKY